ncbi:MAG TPA: glucose-6-phosphate dehydrogenase [Bryobacteraceae bacterium]|jgi:glucose-6-phosphate 1-dehydrogenase|nr:glucose-6-phosphate dehydrogenase [Bryobacteraceae bacterium]
MPQESRTDLSLQDPLRFHRKTPPCAVVIFGANGDLTKRKLMPALYRLAYEGRLAPGFTVIGLSRTPMSDDEFREHMREAVSKFLEDSPFEEELWKSFAQGLFYIAGDVADANTYQTLADRLKQIEQSRHLGGNVLFYLSTQPSQYAVIAEGLGAAGLAKRDGGSESWRRIVIEKPFGHDLTSAKELNERLQKVFDEDSIYRIDHYLGKETVQNILAFRFGNGIFEPLWNRRYIEHVQITAAESIGVEGRGAYYQESGALRDMVQNHLLQVMATVAMEPSATFSANAVRDERAKLLRSIHIMKPEEVAANAVPGQYGRGRVGGQDVPAFREEKGVAPDSQTETFAAVMFTVENWRWANVPFYIRTGKHLPKRVSEIAIQFRSAPLAVFRNDFTDSEQAAPNLLILRIQPEEGISLKFVSKRPGAGMTLRPVGMDFNYGSSFGERSPSAYETLLLDAIIGDATLYTRQDMVEASWSAVQPILNYWSTQKFSFPNYEPGTWGPAAADEMIARTGHVWRRP